MRRTGRAALFIALTWAGLAWAGPEFFQQVDRDEVGQKDTFTLTVVVTEAPDGAELQFPASKDFEVLSRYQSSQRLFQFGGGQSGVQRVEKYSLVMRALRTGKLTLPPSKMKTSRGTLETAAIPMTVKAGSVAEARPRPDRRARDPFGAFPSLPGFDDDDDAFGRMRLPDEAIPRTDSDLFLRAYLDKSEVFVGEQVTYSIYVYSRLALSSVDNLALPKMDGFWAEDEEMKAGQSKSEVRKLDGVEYEAFLLRRRALFPEKAGNIEIAPASGDVVAGMYWAGQKLHRESNKLTLKVKPAPAGAPSDFRPEQVGEWKLSAEVQPPEVELGQPVTVRVSLEGRGNLKRMVLPRFPPVAGLKVYDPTTSESLSTREGHLGGRRIQEYLVMPQQTGTFTLPGLRFPYLSPKTGTYAVAATPPLTVKVKAAANGPESTASASTSSGSSAKNVLKAGGIRPVRAEATLTAPGPVPWRTPLFLGLAGAPLGLYALTALMVGLRRRVKRGAAESPERQRLRTARENLAEAKKSMTGSADLFFGGLERAVIAALEVKLGATLGGVTRLELSQRLAEAGDSESDRKRVIHFLETCEAARYAPGMAGANRALALAEARDLVEGAVP